MPRRAEVVLQVGGVVRQRRRVLDLEVRAQLGGPGDHAVALADRRDVRVDQPVRGDGGALEPLRRRALQVARERAVLEHERQHDREARGGGQDGDQARAERHARLGAGAGRDQQIRRDRAARDFDEL